MLGQLFYELANYNLVLYAVDSVFNMDFQVPGYDDLGLNLQVASANHFNMVIPTEGYTVPDYVYASLARVTVSGEKGHTV